MPTRVEWGEELFRQGKIEEAKQCFLEELAACPRNPDALNDLGVIMITQKQKRQAEAFFLRAVEAREDYLEARLNLADLCCGQKRWLDAAHHLERALETHPEEVRIINYLGHVHLQAGHQAQARELLQASLGLDPDQTRVIQTLAALEV